MTATRKRLTLAPPTGTYLEMPTLPKATKGALHSQWFRRNLKHATTMIRSKQAVRASRVRNWEELKAVGEQTKSCLGRYLDQYLTQAEKAMIAARITVHWVRNAEKANKIVIDLACSKGTSEVMKTKSMATQEIDPNEVLEDAGIAVWETGLVRLIVQLGHDHPFHILVPTIHRNHSEVREIFKEEIGLQGVPAPDGISGNPPELAGVIRIHLREKFLRAKMAVFGGNFIVTETGSPMIVESEGNGHMCLTLSETLISMIGIEKLMPIWEDLGVFLRLLPRSSTGERMNLYTSIRTGVTPGDGLQDLHAVLLDNGYTKVLFDSVDRKALRYIHYSACMNVCPVYERVGGHTYGSVYPGPIGAILTPRLRGITSKVDKSLPYVFNLCEACNDVYPVEILIPDILVHMRSKMVQKKTAHRPIIESVTFRLVGWVMARGCDLVFVQFSSRLAG